MKFLVDETRRHVSYDIIVIDPPTISRSKKMEDMFDVQQEYIFLIQQALKLLAPEGVIYFSTNFRKFNFDISIFPQIDCVDISQKTIPFDFHNQKIHYCFKITRKRI
jgi:23S rRNA G2069 N7-methylase RlmK/C1962 C5-methylase RlmI